MADTFTPEDYSRRRERIRENNVAITTYCLEGVWHCKAEIDVPGAGARIAQASDRSREKAESQVREEVRKLFAKK